MRARPLLALVALGAACGEELPFPPAGPGQAPAPAELGPFEVGVRTLVLKDPSRTTEGHTGPRTLVTEIWYPARLDDDHDAGASYRLEDFLPEELVRSLSLELDEITTPAIRDAEPDQRMAPYPLVLFSHGNGGIRVQSTYLTIILASHGFVVMAPDHEGNLLRDFAGQPYDVTKVLGSFVDRADDLSFLIDALGRLPQDDPLPALVDRSRIGAVGHSFGGSTAIRAAGKDRRIGAVVAQAPGGYLLSWPDLDYPLDEIGIPVMVQAGEMDDTIPGHADTVWEHLGPPSYYTILRRAGHFTFSDLCILNSEAVRGAEELGVGDALDDGCGPENLPPEAAFPIIRHHAIGLFNGVLRGSPESLELLGEATSQALFGDEARILSR